MSETESKRCNRLCTACKCHSGQCCQLLRQVRTESTVELPMATQKTDHHEFRKFISATGEGNFTRALFAWQKQLDRERTQRWWAERWGVDLAAVAFWSLPFDSPRFRPVAPRHSLVFDDLREMAGVTMEEYYKSTPLGVSSARMAAPRRR